MGEQYAGDPENFPEDYTIPDDSEPPTGSAVNPAFEALGDRTAWLRVGVEGFRVPLASLAALTAIAAPVNDRVRLVKKFGVYIFDSSSTLPVFSPYVLAPDDATPGRWVRAGNSARNVTIAVPPIPTVATLGNTTRAKAAEMSLYGFLNDNDQPLTIYHKFQGGALVFPHQPTVGGSGTVGVMLCIDHYLVEGATITSVVAGVYGGSGHVALPGTQVSMGLFRQPRLMGSDLPLASLNSAGDFVTDAQATIAAYEAGHLVTLPCNQNNLVEKVWYNYYLQFWNEFGTNAVPGAKLTGFELNMSNASDARFG